MELLDSDDLVKGQLLRKSAQHREQLEEDVKLITERTEKILTNALIIGGALAATYFIVSMFSGSKEKDKKIRKVKLIKEDGKEELVVAREAEAPGVLSQIGNTLASQASVLLLTFAKEKLSEFLQSQSAKKVNVNDRS